MKIKILFLAVLVPMLAYGIGAAGDTPWPRDAVVEVKLSLAASAETNGQAKVSGDLVIRNTGNAPLTIQSLNNRLTLAFVVFDDLGNVMLPKGRAKVDPFFETHDLAAGARHTHHFEKLEFLTGSALFGYDLSPGKTYKVLAVYRPAGPNGPGFASQEVRLEIPK